MGKFFPHFKVGMYCNSQNFLINFFSFSVDIYLILESENCEIRFFGI